MISRTDRSQLAEWWRTVDRPLLAALLFLAFCGLFMSFSASPPVAERIGVDEFHFIKRHALFFFPSMIILVALSFLSPQQVRRGALLLFGFSILLLLATLFVGAEAKGSRRWLAIAALLVAQPDFGQTMLVAAVWGTLFFMAGMSWIWIAAFGVFGISGLTLAYLLFPHVAGRINRFISGEGDNFQVDTGIEAIRNGGWLGQGPGEGTVKNILPDSHTDFSFAVAAEEFGIIACMLLVGLYGFIVLRGLFKSMNERDDYVRMSAAGLVLLFGFQSIINIGVNLKLLPAKGMTLPFISYGGSSLLAMAIGMGFLLALTRKRAEARQTTSVGFGIHRPSPAE